jgi:hypothetical protein
MSFVPSNSEEENNVSNVPQDEQENDLESINESNQTDDDVAEQTTSLDESGDITFSQSQQVILNTVGGYNVGIRSSQLEDVYGSPSLFNSNSIFVYPSSSHGNGFRAFSDVRGEQKMFSNFNPSILDIVDHSKIFSPDSKTDVSLKLADFVYCKYYKKIPNNRLIILRRYPFPTYNNLHFPFNESVKPLSQAITYFGGETDNDLSEILKISGYKNYKELTAELNIVSGQGQNKDMSDSPFSTSNSTVEKGLKVFSAASGRGDLSGREKTKIDALAGKNWENERKGEENVLHKTHIADVGVGANLEFSITFEYKLRSFDGVNPRIAMLDLLTNLMTLCHTNASFWGGQNIVLPNSPKFPFIGNQDDFYRGDYSAYLGSVMDWFSEPFKSGGGLSNLIDGLMSGNLSSLGDALGGLGSKVLDLQSSKSRSSVVGLKALLDSSPIGNYHMTIGNPLQPIAKIGNLICPTFTLTVGDDLGYNDFPTEIKLVVDLKTATPLDSTGVQGIFSNGISSNRMYMKPATFLEIDEETTHIYNGGKMFNKDDIDRANGVVY